MYLPPNLNVWKCEAKNVWKCEAITLNVWNIGYKIKLWEKFKTPCIRIYVFGTQKEFGAQIINKLQNKWHS